MYKIMTVAALLVGLALAPVLGSEFRADAFTPGARGNAQPGSVETGASKRAAAGPSAGKGAAEADEVSSCAWSCQACEPEQGCSQICTEIGECGSVCGVMARCDAGLRWDESACTCVTR